MQRLADRPPHRTGSQVAYIAWTERGREQDKSLTQAYRDVSSGALVVGAEGMQEKRDVAGA